MKRHAVTADKYCFLRLLLQYSIQTRKMSFDDVPCMVYLQIYLICKLQRINLYINFVSKKMHKKVAMYIFKLNGLKNL